MNIGSKIIMNNFFKVVFFVLLFFEVSQAQVLKGDLVLLECQNVENKEQCSYNRIGELLKKELGDEMVNLFLIHSKNSDVFEIDLVMAINEEGRVDKKMFYSNFLSKTEFNVLKKSVLSIFRKNLIFSMPYNDCLKPVISKKRIRLRYFLNAKKEGEKILELIPFEKNLNTKMSVLETLDSPPIHEKCKELKNIEELKKCFSSYVKNYVNLHFTLKNVIDKIDECSTRIYVSFKIDKTGEIVDVEALGSHPSLELEAINVVKSMSNFSPGVKGGKPVGVFYSVPIMIAIRK